MTETEIILLLAKCAAVLLSVFVLLHLLCDEYVRTLECLGGLRRRPAGARPVELARSAQESESRAGAARVRPAPRLAPPRDAASRPLNRRVIP